MKCILSGLDIHKDDASTEHLVPKSRVPQRIWNNPQNLFKAHYILNSIKSDFLPCEFEEEKYNLAFYALNHWKLDPKNRNFIERAIQNWQDGYKPNWCNLCLLKCKENQK